MIPKFEAPKKSELQKVAPKFSRHGAGGMPIPGLAKLGWESWEGAEGASWEGPSTCQHAVDLWSFCLSVDAKFKQKSGAWRPHWRQKLEPGLTGGKKQSRNPRLSDGHGQIILNGWSTDYSITKTNSSITKTYDSVTTYYSKTKTSDSETKGHYSSTKYYSITKKKYLLTKQYYSETNHYSASKTEDSKTNRLFNQTIDKDMSWPTHISRGFLFLPVFISQSYSEGCCFTAGCEGCVSLDHGGGVSWIWRLCTHSPRNWYLWDIMHAKTVSAPTKGVGSLRYHGYEDCVSPDQRGGIFKISWMWSLCTNWPRGWYLWDIVHAKTVSAPTKGVGSLRYHGYEDCVSPDQRGGIFKISWMWSLCTNWPRGWDLWDVMDLKTLRALTQGVRSLRYHGCKDCVSPDPGLGSSWMWRLCMHWPRGWDGMNCNIVVVVVELR